jgi:hypothetical protein
MGREIRPFGDGRAGKLVLRPRGVIKWKKWHLDPGSGYTTVKNGRMFCIKRRPKKFYSLFIVTLIDRMSVQLLIKLA